MEKKMEAQEFLRMVKRNPRRAGRWLDENAKNGINFHFSPSVMTEFEKFLDVAVDDDGNVDTQAMTGVEIGLAIALAAVVGGVIGYAIGSGSGGTTVTVTEEGDGDVNVNCNGDNGNGDGGEEK